MFTILQTEAFRLWESTLKDNRARTLIATRVFRLANGLAGDAAPVGEGISELRIHYGPGYRIYFQTKGQTLLLLLHGGNKQTQTRDIALAKLLARKWQDTVGTDND